MKEIKNIIKARKEDPLRILYRIKAPIVFPGKVYQDMPEHLKEAIIIARIKQSWEEFQERATIPEAVLYLMNASFEAPLNSDYTEIYLYCATQFAREYMGTDVPPDIRVEKLSEYLEKEKNDFLRKLRSASLRRWKSFTKFKKDLEKELAETQNGGNLQGALSKNSTPKKVQLTLF